MMTPAEQEMIAEYRLEHDKCALCHVSDRDEPMDIAHIYGGARRAHEHTNILLLCRKCHSHQHDGTEPSITSVELMRCKWELGELCPAEMAEIACYTERWIFDAANECVLPQHFLDLREQHGHNPQ